MVNGDWGLWKFHLIANWKSNKSNESNK